MFTTKQAAAELNIQPRSVKQLCQRGILKAEKIGRDWLIETSEVERYKTERKSAGRPHARQRRRRPLE
jgi:excisionase family DNA binding protein